MRRKTITVKRIDNLDATAKALILLQQTLNVSEVPIRVESISLRGVDDDMGTDQCTVLLTALFRVTVIDTKIDEVKEPLFVLPVFRKRPRARKVS